MKEIKDFQSLCDELTQEIKNSYESGITMGEAEKLAGKFLYAQIRVTEELTHADLDARMKKTATKAIKAAIYLNAVKQSDKKPSDTYLQNVIDSDSIVSNEQSALDRAEANRDQLDNYYNIFREAHIHFRSIARGSFG